MILPDPPARYDRDTETIRNETLEREDKTNHKRGQHVYILEPAQLILASPNGSHWKITVSNVGVVGATAV